MSMISLFIKRPPQLAQADVEIALRPVALMNLLIQSLRHSSDTGLMKWLSSTGIRFCGGVWVLFHVACSFNLFFCCPVSMTDACRHSGSCVTASSIFTRDRFSDRKNVSCGKEALISFIVKVLILSSNSSE